MALGRKNPSPVPTAAATVWGVVCSLIETCKLNGVEPYAYLADVLTRMAEGHPMNRLDDLLPWAWKGDHHAKL